MAKIKGEKRKPPADTAAKPSESLPVHGEPVSDEVEFPTPSPDEADEPDAPSGAVAVVGTTAMAESATMTPWAAQAADTRKRRGAGQAVPTEGEEVLELLTFQLADEEYAIELRMIREIIRPTAMTPVPRTIPFIKGILSLRGTIIPIFDLRTRLGLSESPQSRHTRILVVTLSRGLMGLIADHVTGVAKVKAGDIEPPPSTGGASSEHLKGVTHADGRFLILLDLEKTVAMT